MQSGKVAADCSGDLAVELGAVLTRLYSFLRVAILPEGMTLTQASALATLRDEGPQRVTELASREGVRQPTCTGLVNLMEEQGWVRRRVDTSDRRAVVVELTKCGRRTLAAITSARTEVLERRLRALSDQERDALAAALPSLMKFIDVGVPAGSRPPPEV
jgi:DNA-binding MarR family transcriptional regulator